MKVGTRKYYRKKIADAFLQQKAHLKKKLADALWMCSTADAWSCRRKSFIGVTIHWIASDLSRQSACLAVRRVVGTCNYEVIGKLLEAINEEFEITPKITCTITDNGSNFIKSFKVFGTKNDESQERASIQSVDLSNFQTDNSHFPQAKPRSMSSQVFRHQTNDYLNEESITDMLSDIESEFHESSEEDGLDDAENADLVPGIRKIGADNGTKDKEQLVQDGKPDEGAVNFIPLTDILKKKASSRTIYCLPKHRRCACHLLSLVAKKDIFVGLDASLKNLMDFTEKKLLALWSKQNRSSKAADAIYASLDELFVVNNETRWNSYFDALVRVRRFLNTKKADLKKLFTHFKIDYFRPAEEEFIKEYVKVMRPISEALDVLQADIKVNVGYLLPTLRLLLEKMEKLKHNSEVKHCKSIVNNLKNSVKKRFAECFDDEELKIAAMLNPQFKTSWIDDIDKKENIDLLISVYLSFKESNPANRYIAFFIFDLFYISLLEICKEFSKNCLFFRLASAENDDRSDTDSDFNSPQPKKRKIFFRSLKKKKVCTEANEVDLFLADESTETSSLENYPTLKKMYMKYNAALPSSASVERLFSAGGLIFIPTRANLSDENFEKLLFLKVNKFE